MNTSIQRLTLLHARLLVLILPFIFGSCSKENISDGPVPLNDPELFTYNGLQSGLYPWGNEPQDNAFESNYMAACGLVKSLSDNNLVAAQNKVVVLGIGGSNPGIIFDGFIHAQQNDPGFGQNLLFLNGGIESQDFSNLLNPQDNYWSQMTNLLSSNHVSASDVSVIFCIEDNLSLRDTSFQRALDLKANYISLLDIIRDKFPNCKLMLLGDRGYSGYSTDPKHQEPVGYLNGWAVKMVIADYINNALPQYPVVNWLDYYWANGETPRWDGLTYSETDFHAPDYVHFTQEKADALAASTHARLKADPGASLWYR